VCTYGDMTCVCVQCSDDDDDDDNNDNNNIDGSLVKGWDENLVYLL
jgi:hypothetical protein